MKIIVLLCMMLSMTLVQGCAEKWVNVHVSPNEGYKAPNKQKYEKNYDRNVRRKVYVGQEMIKVKPFIEKVSMKQQVEVSETIYVDTAGKSKLAIGAQVYPLKEMVRYDEKNKIGDSGQTYFLLPVTNSQDDWRWGVLVGEDGIISDKAMYCYNNSMLWSPPTLTVKPNIKHSISQTIKEIMPGPGVSFELIYTGVNDVSFNVTYREYTTDNLARPSFFQNITYKTDAKQIRFKNFVLQIHEVTNEKLDFTVAEDGLREDE